MAWVEGLIDLVAALVIALMLSVVAASICSCQPPLPPYPNKDCASACLRLNELGCDEGDPSPERGVPCTTWCSQVHEVEYMRPWAPCVSQAGDVDAVRACGVRCE